MHDDVTERIVKVCESAKRTLLAKNAKYGNAALQPLGIFAKHINPNDIAETGLLFRIDDKLSRVKAAEQLNKNDIFDLIGYLSLLSVKKDWTFEELID